MCLTSITASTEPRVCRSFVPSGMPRASMGCPGSTRCSVRRGWKQSLRGVLCRRSALCLSLSKCAGWSNVRASASSPLLHAMSLSATDVVRAPRLSALLPLASTPHGCLLQAPGCRPRSSVNTPRLQRSSTPKSAAHAPSRVRPRTHREGSSPLTSSLTARHPHPQPPPQQPPADDGASGREPPAEATPSKRTVSSWPFGHGAGSFDASIGRLTT